MPIMECLGKMGFSKEETKAILEDIGDGKASEIVREHIAALEAERADIVKQATLAKPAEAAKPKGPDISPMRAEQERQILDQFPDLQVPDATGEPVSVSELLQRADAELEAARKDAGLYDVAVACFLGGAE